MFNNTLEFDNTFKKFSSQYPKTTLNILHMFMTHLHMKEKIRSLEKY